MTLPLSALGQAGSSEGAGAGSVMDLSRGSLTMMHTLF